MKKKELKQIATQIAKLELIISQDDDQSRINQAKESIMHLVGRVSDPEDLFAIDELVQEILEQKKLD